MGFFSGIFTNKLCYCVSKAESKCYLQLKNKQLKLKIALITVRMYFIYLWIAGSREKVVGRGKHAGLGQHREPSSGAWGLAELDTLPPGQQGKTQLLIFINSKVR